MRNTKLIILGSMIVVLAIGIITLERPADLKVAQVEDEDLPMAGMSIAGIELDARRVEMMSSGTTSKFTGLLNAPRKKNLCHIQIQNETLSVGQAMWLDVSGEIICSGKDPDGWDAAAIKANKLRLALKDVGLTTDPELADWLSSVEDSTPERKTITLTISDAVGTEIRRITLFDAYPVRWEGPDLTAAGRALTIQRVEFKYCSLEMADGAD